MYQVGYVKNDLSRSSILLPNLLSFCLASTYDVHQAIYSAGVFLLNLLVFSAVKMSVPLPTCSQCVKLLYLKAGLHSDMIES